MLLTNSCGNISSNERKISNNASNDYEKLVTYLNLGWGNFLDHGKSGVNRVDSNADYYWCWDLWPAHVNLYLSDLTLYTPAFCILAYRTENIPDY